MHKNLKDQQIKEGDLVLVKNHSLSDKVNYKTFKLTPKYRGPYEVIEKVGQNAFAILDKNNVIKKIQCSSVKKIFHEKRLVSDNCDKCKEQCTVNYSVNK